MTDKKERIDIHQYLAEFDDIPGTRVFTAKRARQGYWLNQFAMSLMKEENRTRFLADEKAYLDEWQLSDEAKEAVLDSYLLPAVAPPTTVNGDESYSNFSPQVAVGYRVQPDHVAIRERHLAAWTTSLEPLERRWRGAYLCCVYAKHFRRAN